MSTARRAEMRYFHKRAVVVAAAPEVDHANMTDNAAHEACTREGRGA